MERIPMFRRHAEAKRFLFDLMNVRDGEMFRSPAEDMIVTCVLSLDSLCDLGQMRTITELVRAYKLHLDHAPLIEALDLSADDSDR